LSLADCLAMYAAALSTAIAIWNVIQARPRIKVVVIAGLDSSGPTSRFGAYVQVRNVSSHGVPLAAITLLYRYGPAGLGAQLKHMVKYRCFPSTVGWVHSRLSLHDVDDECPTVVAARSSHLVFIPQVVLDKIGRETGERVIMCSVQDQLANDFLSNQYSWNCPSPE
jgi:hypothetical protein